MRSAPLNFLAALSVAQLSVAAFAQESQPAKAPEPQAPQKAKPTAAWRVQISTQMVAVPEAAALALLPDLQSNDRAKVDAANAKIQEMLKKKEAVLLAWPLLVGLSGGRELVESIVEKRFPTQAEPEPDKDSLAVDQGMTTPTAFETRNTGVTVEAEATVSDDGKLIHMNIVPQRVSLMGFSSVEIGKKKDGTSIKSPVPDFATTKSTTAILLKNGEYFLLGVHKLPEPAEHLELVIVRVTATKIE
jgi:hypothetical protein